MKIWKYPDDVAGFIEEHAGDGSISDMMERVNARFGTSFTYGSMKAYFANHKLHAAPRKGRPYTGKKLTTPEQDTFIREHLEGTGHQDMADLVNARFGTSFTQAQMKAYYARNKLNSGLTGRFEAGHVPENKGKTWDEYMSPEAQEKARQTQFQKGHTPHNGGTPVGTVRLRHDHKERPGSRPYYWEKVAEPDVWRMKHVVEWEKMNGPVPDGCMVTFADGDSLNWHIENLVLETRAQHAVRNRWRLRSYDRESAETVQRIADLKMAVSAKKKRRRGRS